MRERKVNSLTLQTLSQHAIVEKNGEEMIPLDENQIGVYDFVNHIFQWGTGCRST